MPDIPKATVRELAYKIKGVGEAPSPRFAFFLGAGASTQSGIPTASGMIGDFKRRIIQAECPDCFKTDAEKEKWLTEQPWYQPDNLYSCLFEKFEPKEIGRQGYIEGLIEGHKPSFGYVVLANLMERGYINAVITTNFDDLIYSACTTYTDIRPIVFAYGILASEMRVRIKRPKILKLHGDYLYSALKNTTQETESQDPNMARQVLQVLNEFGLIVVGYGGGDKSVMDVLDQISEKNDLYWCIRRGDKPNDRVKALLQKKGGFLVEINSFVQMMNEIRGIVGFDVRSMLGSMQNRQEQMVDEFKSFAPENKLADVLDEIANVLAEQATHQQAQSQKNRALGFFAQALKDEVEGRHGDAEAAYRKAIELDPNDATAYNNLGLLLADDAARRTDAEAAYNRAIEIGNLPDGGASAYNNLGNLLAKDAARRTDAEAVYRKAIELDPNDAAAYNNLGLLLDKDAARRTDAEAVYRKAIELDPNDAAAYNNLGLLLANDAAHRTDAEATYRKAIELDPKLAQAHNNLGLLLADDAARRTDAEANYRKAIELDPNYAKPYNNLGALLAKDSTRRTDAETAYRKTIELDPNDAAAYYNLGALLAKDAAHRTDAEAAYRKAIELGNLSNNELAQVYNNLGALLAKDAARRSDAEAAYRKAIELDPNLAQAYSNLGLLLADDAARRSDAEAAYRKAIELNPNLAQAHYNLGNLLADDTTRRSDAEAAYRKAIELGNLSNNELAQVYNNLGALLAKDVARRADAEAAYRKAIELDPANSRRYNTLALFLRQHNREVDTFPLLARCLQLDPKDFDALLALASVHKKLGHTEESAKFAAQARALVKLDDWYNLACLESVCGNVDAAIDNLRRAAQSDKFDRDWAKRDPDLEWIRGDPRFREIVGD